MSQLIGILNLTPDSFSGDGARAGDALAQIDAMIEDGAAVIDVGAESTRPGATLLSPEEEWQRLAPVLDALGRRVEAVTFSIDTRHVATAQKALTFGFAWVNDVSGAPGEEMRRLISARKATLVLMHSLGVPADPRRAITGDAVVELLDWAHTSLAQLEQSGIPRSRIILDPGIGFGKTAEQSLALIKHIARFKTLGVKLLVGHSRKSFLSLFTDKPPSERDPETLAVSYYLAGQGVDFLRVHDVKSHAAMLRVRSAL